MKPIWTGWTDRMYLTSHRCTQRKWDMDDILKMFLHNKTTLSWDFWFQGAKTAGIAFKSGSHWFWLGCLNRAALSLMLTITPVLFLLWQQSGRLTWRPFWPGRLRCPDVCRLGWQKTRGHCCWSPLCWSTPIHQMEAGSWCGGRPAQDHKF